MMTMSPSLRRLALTAHVVVSVGWLGAVAGFLALAIFGLTSTEAQTVRAAYLAMNLIGWAVTVPLCVASLPTGLIMSLGTEWGLVRHYWVVAKLLISVFATVLLLVHMQPVGHLARIVATTTLAHGELAGLRFQLVADAGAAMIALLAATVLSVYKPRGLTGYGVRRVAEGSAGALGVASASSPATKIAVATVAVIVLTFILLHLSGAGLASH